MSRGARVVVFRTSPLSCNCYDREKSQGRRAANISFAISIIDVISSLTGDQQRRCIISQTFAYRRPFSSPVEPCSFSQPLEWIRSGSDTSILVVATILVRVLNSDAHAVFTILEER